MSKAVLISIHPEWCSQIENGLKTIEIRKTRPKISTPFKCYIYCASREKPFEGGYIGLRKVIGEFVCDRIEEFESEFYSDDSVFNAIYRVVEDEDYPDVLTAIASNEDDSKNFWICTQSCLSFDEIKEYVGYDKSEKTFYGWHISDLVIYDKPKELREFKGRKLVWRGNNHIHAYETITRPPQSWCYVYERCFI